MSDWKDTVMTEGQIKQAVANAVANAGDEIGQSLAASVAKAQAEISFKAGYDLAKEELAGIQILNFRDGKRAGRREVVEWINEMADIENFKDAPKLIGFTILSEDWQAKLKEWGIIWGGIPL